MMKLDDIFTKSIKTCAIVGHVSPDGDAVGSVTALYGYVRKNFPWIDVELYIERPKESLMFLPGLADAFFDTPEDSVRDLFVSCDVSSTDRFGVAGNYIIILTLAMHLDHELVKRVIVALPHFHGPPGITTLNLPLQPHLLGLFAVGFLLGLILHLEQQTLLLECQYRRILLITHKAPAKLQNRNEYLKEIVIIRIIII